MEEKRREKINQLNQKLEELLTKSNQAKAEDKWEKAAEFHNEISELKFRLSIMSQTSSRLEEIALEIDLHIESWLDSYNEELEDKGAKRVQLDYYNELIEQLFAEYAVEKNYDDKVFGVPLSLCLNAPLGNAEYNGANYSASHNISTWLKHIAGVELSDQVSTSNNDKELKELALNYWNHCLSKMSEFE
jgi:hypothetical protein